MNKKLAATLRKAIAAQREELERQNMRACDPIREIPLEDIRFSTESGLSSQREDAKPLGVGGLGAVYAVDIPQRPHESLVVKILKEHHTQRLQELPDDTQQAICSQMARAIFVADHERFRKLKGLALPVAYAVSEEGSLLLFMRRLDINGRQLLNTLDCPADMQTALAERVRTAYPGKEGRRLLLHHTILSALQTATDYQESGERVLHRDYKPTNFLVSLDTVLAQSSVRDTASFLALQKESPFVYVTDWDLAYFGEIPNLPNATELLGANDGTPFYTSVDIAMGTASLEKRRDPQRDVVSMGWTIAELALGLEAPSENGDVTRVLQRDQWLASDAPRTSARELGCAGLEDVVTLAVRYQIKTMRELRDMTVGAFDGTLKESDVRATTPWKHALRDRVIPESELYTHTIEQGARMKQLRSWSKRIGIPVVAATIALLARDVWTAHRYEQNYAQSPQAAARALAANPDDSSLWQEYDRRWIATLAHDDATIFAVPKKLERQNRPNSTTRVAAGSTSRLNDGKVYLLNGTDFVTSTVIAEHLVAYRSSPTPDRLRSLAFYLDQMQLELYADPLYSDYIAASVGRFEVPLAYRDELTEIAKRERGAHPLEAAFIEESLVRARYGAFLAAHQAMRIADVRHNKQNYNVRTEMQLTPLVSLVATMPDILTFPKPSRDRFPEERDAWNEITSELERYGELDVEHLPEIVLRRGVRVCDALVLPSGKSFGRVLQADGKFTPAPISIYNPKYSDEEERTIPDDEKFTIMVDHAALMLAQATRLSLAARLPPSERERLRDPIAKIEDCAQRLEGYYLRATNNRTVLPGEFFGRMPAVITADNAPLAQDARAHALDLRYLVERGRFAEARAGLLRLYGTARNRVPEKPSTILPISLLASTTPGPYLAEDGTPLHGFDFPDARGYDSRYHGPTSLATGNVRRVQLAVREAMEKRE